MKKYFKWYDIFLILFLGPAIGGYCAIAVPCFTYDRPDMPCLVAGFIGSAAAFHDFNSIVKSKQAEIVEIKYWIIAATTVVFMAITTK